MSFRERIFDKPPESLTAEKQKETYDVAMGLLRALDILQGEKRAVIDFDLTKGPTHSEAALIDSLIGKPSKESYERIVQKFSSLLAQFEEAKPSNLGEAHNWEFVRARTEACIAYIKKLIDPSEQDNIAYIETTNGVEAEMIPEEVLEHFKEKVFNNARAVLGVEEITPRNITDLQARSEIDQEIAQNRLKQAILGALGSVGRFIGRRLSVDFEIRPVDENKYFYAWACTDPETRRFVVKQNFSRKSKKIWTRGKAQEMGWHEGGAHLGMRGLRKDFISKEKLHPYFGLTSVFGPEPIIDEGLGQTLPYFIQGEYARLTDESKFQVDHKILKNMVYGNVHLMVNSPIDYPIDRIVEYVRGYLPWETKEDVQRQISTRTKDPLFQTYLYAYGYGAWKHYGYAQLLSDRGKRLFLKEIYEKPYTPGQEKILVKNLLKDPRNNIVDRKKKPSSDPLISESCVS